MRLFEGFGNLSAEAHDLSHVQRTPGDYLIERATFDILHGDKVCAVGFAHIVDVSRVLALEFRGGARLL